MDKAWFFGTIRKEYRLSASLLSEITLGKDVSKNWSNSLLNNTTNMKAIITTAIDTNTCVDALPVTVPMATT